MGVKIGLIGVTTAETPRTTLPDFVRGLAFLPITDGLRRGIREAKALGAEVIIALVHAGAQCEDLSDPTDVSRCNLRAELPSALGKLGSSGLDAVVAGHTHGHIAHFLSGVPTIESGSAGQEFGRIDLYLDPNDHHVLRDRTRIARPHPFCSEVVAGTERCDQGAADAAKVAGLLPATYVGQAIMPDARVAQVLEPYRQAIRDQQARLIVHISKPIRRVGFGESPLGDLVTDCMREATLRDPNIPDADFAIQNSGGIRSDIEPGPFTFGKLYEVLPFDNVLVTASLTGDQIRRIFELALAANGRVFQVSGLRVVYGVSDSVGRTSADPLDPSVHDYRVLQVELPNGKALDSHGHYTLVWNDFLAHGGDGVLPLVTSFEANAQRFHPSTSLRQAVEATLRAKPGIIDSVLRRGAPRIVFERR